MIPAGAVVGHLTFFGDVNFDDRVTGDDYTIVDANLNTNPAAGIEWMRGDANVDGVVTGDDYTTIDANLGSGVALRPASRGEASLSLQHDEDDEIDELLAGMRPCRIP